MTMTVVSLSHCSKIIFLTYRWPINFRVTMTLASSTLFTLTPALLHNQSEILTKKNCPNDQLPAPVSKASVVTMPPGFWPVFVQNQGNPIIQWHELLPPHNVLSYLTTPPFPPVYSSFVQWSWKKTTQSPTYHCHCKTQLAYQLLKFSFVYFLLHQLPFSCWLSILLAHMECPDKLYIIY